MRWFDEFRIKDDEELSSTDPDEHADPTDTFLMEKHSKDDQTHAEAVIQDRIIQVKEAYAKQYKKESRDYANWHRQQKEILQWQGILEAVDPMNN